MAAGASMCCFTGRTPDNGFIEAFNRKLRAECLNAHWFLTLADAREKMEDWRRHYNEDRPHSAIGYNVPNALHNPGGDPSPSPWKKPENSNLRRSKLRSQCNQPKDSSPYWMRIGSQISCKTSVAERGATMKTSSTGRTPCTGGANHTFRLTTFWSISLPVLGQGAVSSRPKIGYPLLQPALRQYA